jgi:hypothetical protein
MASIISNGNHLLGSYAASIPEVKGLPVPNNPDAIDWWQDQLDEDINKTLARLAALEAKGVKWAGWLFNKLCY